MAKEQTTHGGASLATLGFEPWTPNYWETGVDSEQLDARSSATEKDWILACELTACSRWIVQGFHLNEQVMPFLEKKNVEHVKLSSNVSNEFRALSKVTANHFWSFCTHFWWFLLPKLFWILMCCTLTQTSTPIWSWCGTWTVKPRSG